MKCLNDSIDLDLPIMTDAAAPSCTCQSSVVEREISLLDSAATIHCSKTPERFGLCAT